MILNFKKQLFLKIKNFATPFDDKKRQVSLSYQNSFRFVEKILQPLMLVLLLVATTSAFGQTPPTITSLSPTTAAVGETVTITGTGFDTTPANNVVYFGSVKATVSTATSSQLTVVVPAGAHAARLQVINNTSNLVSVSGKRFIPQYNLASIFNNNSYPDNFSFGSLKRGPGDNFIITDVNADSKPDFLYSNNNTLSYNTNNSVLATTPALSELNTSTQLSSWSGSGSSLSRSITASDFNGDGALDVMCGNAGYSGSKMLLGSSNGTFTQQSYSPSSYQNAMQHIDLENDGDIDIISSYSHSSINFYEQINNTVGGDATVSFSASISSFTTSYKGSIIGDLDGNGFSDIVIANGSSLEIRPIDANGYMTTVSISSVTGYDIALADFDGDGLEDILTTSSSGLVVFLNTSTSGNVSFGSANIISTINTMNSFDVVDLNNDGLVDIISSTTTRLYAYENASTSGSISFNSEKQISSSATTAYDLKIVDINNDGIPEIALGGSTIRVHTFQAPPSISVTQSLTDFEACPNAVSNSQSFTVSGANLTANITVEALSGYEYSLDDNTFTDTVTLTQTSGTVADTTVYIRLKATSSDVSGNVVLSSTGATDGSVAVSSAIYTTPTLSLSNTSLVYTINQAISSITVSSDIAMTSFSVSPALPNGLSLNTTTGEITGTPTVSSAATNYTITGVSTDNCEGTLVVSMAVNELPSITAISDLVNCPNAEVSATTAITDNETAAANLTVVATSSDQAIVTDANIVVANTGDNFTFTITPLSDITGTVTITVTVTDETSGVSTDTFEVTFDDTVLPTVVTQNITAQLDANGLASIVASDIDNGSSDNCSIASMTLDVTTFDCDDLGDNTVTLTVTDSEGNLDTETATVTVVDNENPTALANNFSITTYDWSNGNYAFLPGYVNNGSSDNCGIAIIELARDENSDNLADSGFNDRINVTCADVGNTFDYLFRVTDDSGNQTIITRTLTVEDNTAPTAAAQDITVQLDATGNASITAADIDNNSSDDCGIASMTLDITDFDCDNIAGDLQPATVTIEQLDSNVGGGGNSSWQSFTAISAEVLTEIQILHNRPNSQQATTMYLELYQGEGINGTLIAEATNTQIVGPASNQQFYVYGFNNIPLTLGETYTWHLYFTTSQDVGFTNFSTLNPYAFGLADGDINDDYVFKILTAESSGTNMVTLTVTDNAGNTTTASANVTVTDNIVPTVVTQDITVQLDANNNATITTANIDNGSSDNCSIASMSLDITDFDCDDLGDQTVTLTVTDINGNSDSASATVTVEDGAAPNVVTQNITVQLDANGNASITAANIDNGSSDACSGIASMTLDITDFDCSDVNRAGDLVYGVDQDGDFYTLLKDDNNALELLDVQNLDLNGSYYGLTFDSTYGIGYLLAQNPNNGERALFALNLTTKATTFITDLESIGGSTQPQTITTDGQSGLYVVYNGGEIEQYNPFTDTATAFATVDSNGGVGLTYDYDNNRLIYATGQSPVTLYAIDQSGVVSTLFDVALPNAQAIEYIGNNILYSSYVEGSTGSVINLTTQAVSDIEQQLGNLTTGITLGADIKSFMSTNLQEGNTVQLTVTDLQGNSASASANVTVVENDTNYTIACSDIAVSNDAGQAGAFVTIPTPNVTSDNCPVNLLTEGPRVTFEGDETDDLADTTYELAGVTTSQGNDIDLKIVLNGDFGSGSECFVLEGPDGSVVIDRCNIASDGVTAVISTDIDATTWDNWVSTYGNTLTFTLLADSSVDLDEQNWLQLYVNYGSYSSLTNDYTNTTNASAFYSLGDTLVTWTFISPSGITSTCSFTVTVNDTEAPVLTFCPDDITSETSEDSCEAVVTYDLPTATDNTDISELQLVLTAFDAASTDLSNLVPNVYDFELDDGLNANFINDGGDDMYDDGNFINTNFEFEISYSDGTVINSSAFGNTGAYVTRKGDKMWLLAADLDQVSSFTIEGNLGADGDGQASGYNTTINVNGTTYRIFVKKVQEDDPGSGDPSINHLIIIPENTNATQNFASDTDDDFHEISNLTDTNRLYYLLFAGEESEVIANSVFNAIATDFLEAVDNAIDTQTSTLTITQTEGLASGSVFPLGTTTNTFEVADASGNITLCTFDVTVEDTTDPTMITQDITVQLGANGQVALTPDMVDNGSNDNCDFTLTVTPSNFGCANIGVNTVLLIGTDSSGNQSFTTAQVTVEDVLDPTITAPDTVTVSTDDDACTTAFGNVVLGTPVTADNCSVASVTNDAPAVFDLGDTTITWTVTDASGNTATATQIVTVVDNVLPTITAPADVSVTTNADCTAINVDLGNPVTADNCTVDTVTNDAPTAFDLGDTTVTWTVTDAAGNIATATQTVTIVDNVNPTITAPDALTVSVNNNCIAFNVDLGTPITTDNCSVNTVTNDAPVVFDLGDTTVTWTVTDGSGNTETATQIVTVVDNVLPTISAPAAITLDTNTDCTTTGYDLGNPVTADNCSIATVTNDAPAALPLGDTTVTWTVTDGAGNTETATQVVTVVDNVLPTANAQDITVSLNELGQATILFSDIDNNSADNCSIATMSVSPSTFTCSDLGENTVTLTVTDNNGNIATTTATVTVEDTIAPEIVSCPEDVLVDANANEVYIMEDFLSTLTLTDNCTDTAALIVTQTPAVGESLSPGIIPVTITVTDANGNTETCDFSITASLGDDRVTLDDLRIYPNPTKDVVIISKPRHVVIKKITVYDLVGREVQRYNYAAADTAIQVNLQDLPIASYVLHIQGANGLDMYKMIIKK